MSLCAAGLDEGWACRVGGAVADPQCGELDKGKKTAGLSEAGAAGAGRGDARGQGASRGGGRRSDLAEGQGRDAGERKRAPPRSRADRGC